MFLGTPVSLDMFFSHEKIHFNSGTGWVCVLASLLAASLGACALVAVVERAKKCLDFAFTVYAFHFTICWLYGGFPDRWEWWVVEGVDLAVMAVLGEFLCMRRELSEIWVSDFLRIGGSRSSGGSGGGGGGGAGGHRRVTRQNRSDLST